MATVQLPRDDALAYPGRYEPPLRWVRHTLWLLGAVAGAGLLVLAFSREGPDTATVLAVLAGWSFIGSGLIAWRHRPEGRLGPIMALVGVVWFSWRLLAESDSPPVFTAAMWLSDLWVVFFAFFLVSFPDGRLASKRDYALLAPFVVAVVPLELLWFLFLDLEGQNVLLVWPNEAVANNIDWVQRVLLVLGSAAVTAVLARRWLRASSALRRVLTPILVGAAAIMVGAVTTVLAKFTTPPEIVTWVVLSTMIAVPLAVLVGLLRARLARSAVGDLMVELRDAPTPGELQRALARALHDPSVEIAYWVPEYAAYVDAEGRPLVLPSGDDGRAVTTVEQGGRTVAALVHDASLREEPELVAAVTAAAGIALENERLQADLRARLEELRGSRARIVEAGDAERRRLERDLHDGAQQRLVTVSVGLHLIASRVEPRLRGGRAARADQRRGRGFARGAALAGAGHPPGGADRPRPRGRARDACREGLASGPARGRRGRAASGGRRGGRLLPRLGGSDQRRQVRGVALVLGHGRARRRRSCSSRSSTTGWAAPIPAAAPASAGSPTGSRRWGAASACGARTAAGRPCGRRSRAGSHRRRHRSAARRRGAPAHGGGLRRRRPELRRGRPPPQGAQLLAGRGHHGHPHAADPDRRGPARGARRSVRRTRTSACWFSPSTRTWGSP